MNETLEQITARATAEAGGLAYKFGWSFVRECGYRDGVIAEATRDKWIRVEDRLPEIVQNENDWKFSDEVLGYAPICEEDGTWQAKICYYRIDPEGRIHWTGLRPTHWQPLPTPPSK